jgi:rhomboid protease GluP
MAKFAALFVPRKGYMVTPILVDLNLAIFLVMAVSGVSLFAPTIQSLIDWGANIRSLTLDGQWWRLITNTFIHIGILHVLLNMYALLYIGVLLEPRLGSVRFIAAYLLTGIVASLTSLYWHPAVVSAGASGAIFGMYGVFLALLTTNFIDKTVRATLMTSIAIFVGYNLLNGTKGGVDNAAHIGGLVSGIVIGYLFFPGLRNPAKPALQYSGLAAAIVLALVVTVVAFKKIPNDFPVLQGKFATFARLESQALALLQPKDGVSLEAQRNAIHDSGIRDWDSSIIVLNQAGKLQVTDELKGKAAGLIRYCDWRILSYNYIYKRMADTTGMAAEDSIAYYNAKIKAVIDSLSAGNQ